MAQTEPSASGHRADSQRPKVIYLMGAGRSGSTILGVALGNCSGIFYAGELDKWLPRAGEPKLADERTTGFWQSVRALIGDPEAPFGGRAHKYLERSSALFRVNARSVRRQLRGPYRRTMSELYAAIATTAGATHVVDSSHYPLRARELQALGDIDLYLVMLVRDPQRVIASFARDDVVEPRFGPNKTRAYLLLTYLLSVWVFAKQRPERRLVLFHEDLLDDPPGVLRSVLDHVGCSSPIPDLSSLSIGAPLQGNRLIRDEVVSLKRREPTSRGLLPGNGPLERLMVAGLSRLRPRAAGAGVAPAARLDPS
jgi:hypothetical protein